MPRQGQRCDFVKNDSSNELQRVCADAKKAATACPLDDPSPFSFLLQLVGARTPLPRVQSAFGSQAHCLRAASHEYTVVGLDRQKATTTRLTRHLATKKDERSAAEQHHLAAAGLQKPDEPPTTHHALLLSRCRDTPQSSVNCVFIVTCERRLAPPRFQSESTASRKGQRAI